jgi:hypothetical protein
MENRRCDQCGRSYAPVRRPWGYFCCKGCANRYKQENSAEAKAASMVYYAIFGAFFISVLIVGLLK